MLLDYTAQDQTLVKLYHWRALLIYELSMPTDAGTDDVNPWHSDLGSWVEVLTFCEPSEVVGHLSILVELNHELECLAIYFHVIRRDERLDWSVASFQLT